MFKKQFFNPIVGLGCIVASSWLFVRFAGTPRTPLDLLGTLSLVGIIALAAFSIVASTTYRSDRTSGGTGVLSVLILSLGATIIAFTITAAAFGMSAAITYAGMAVIAALATVAMAALSRR